MRFLCFLFLLAFAGVVGGIAYYNQQEVTLRFLQWSYAASLALVIGASYLLGMVSGWSIVGMLRRTLRRVAEVPMYRQAPVAR